MRWAVLVLTLLLPAAGRAAEPELPLLERYVFELAGWPKAELSLLDPSLGPGGAQLRLEVRPGRRDSAEVRIAVFRHVPQDFVMFALLLEKVRLQFTGADGGILRTIVLDDVLGPEGLFVIGDSNDGYFEHRVTVRDLRAARRLTVELWGNYE